MVTGESAGRSRKSVWFDICHTPQYNFYKNFIIRLAEEGHVVYLTVLDRGKMPLIVRKELAAYPAIKIYVIGRHRLAKWSAIVDANLRLKIWFSKISHYCLYECQFDTDCQTVFMVIG